MALPIDEEEAAGKESPDSLPEIVEPVSDPNSGRARRLPRNSDGATFTATAFVEQHSGPLPSPRILAQYNEIAPNAADRIITVFEKQSEHRMILEKEVVRANIISDRRGSNYALVIALAVLTLAAYFGSLGLALPAITAVLGSMGTLVATFINGKKKQSDELKSNRDALEAPAEERKQIQPPNAQKSLPTPVSNKPRNRKQRQ